MAELDLEEYFEKDDKEYYDAGYLVSVLEDIIGSDIENIKADVNRQGVYVTKDKITKYLDEQFVKNDEKLKRRLENKNNRDINMSNWNKEDMNSSVQQLMDEIAAEKYSFNPQSLEYFNTYVNILKNKLLSLLDLISKIGRKDFTTVQDLVASLDINFDGQGNISKDDIIRLLKPTIYNFNEFNEMISKANNLSTYLNFKLFDSTKGIVSEDDLYPTEELQVMSLNYEDEGSIPLSLEQVKRLERREKRKHKKHVKTITSKF